MSKLTRSAALLSALLLLTGLLGAGASTGEEAEAASLHHEPGADLGSQGDVQTPPALESTVSLDEIFGHFSWLKPVSTSWEGCMMGGPTCTLYHDPVCYSYCGNNEACCDLASNCCLC